MTSTTRNIVSRHHSCARLARLTLSLPTARISAAAVALALIFSTSPRASAQSTQSLSVDFLITGLDPAGCLAHAEGVLRETGFGNIKQFNVGVGGRNDRTVATILCLPSKVVSFSVAGSTSDATNAALNSVKETFVNSFVGLKRR
jgi:hypothetical protein